MPAPGGWTASPPPRPPPAANVPCSPTRSATPSNAVCCPPARWARSSGKPPKSLRPSTAARVASPAQARRLLKAVRGQGPRGEHMEAFFGCLYRPAANAPRWRVPGPPGPSKGLTPKQGKQLSEALQAAGQTGSSPTISASRWFDTSCRRSTPRSWAMAQSSSQYQPSRCALRGAVGWQVTRSSRRAADLSLSPASSKPASQAVAGRAALAAHFGEGLGLNASWIIFCRIAGGALPSRQPVHPGTRRGARGRAGRVRGPGRA
jgi:hypothetical protein